MKYGLKPHIIDKLNEQFSTHPHIEQVVIYGSRAKGNYRAGSDIDFVLKAPEMAFNELLQLEQEIDDLLLPYKIDISLYHQIDDESFLAHIQSAGLVFYDKDKYQEVY